MKYYCTEIRCDEDGNISAQVRCEGEIDNPNQLPENWVHAGELVDTYAYYFLSEEAAKDLCAAELAGAGI